MSLASFMHLRFGWRTALGATVLCTACLSHGSQSTNRRLDRAVITREQMIEAKYNSVYDAVAAMRSLWLQPRGPDSFVAPSIVWVYIDNARAGNVDVLRNMQPRMINTVRFYDGPSATSRWGVDNAAGVIHVSTWSEGAAGIPLPDSTRRRPPDFH
jgi:hypothetical protein